MQYTHHSATTLIMGLLDIEKGKNVCLTLFLCCCDKTPSKKTQKNHNEEIQSIRDYILLSRLDNTVTGAENMETCCLLAFSP